MRTRSMGAKRTKINALNPLRKTPFSVDELRRLILKRRRQLMIDDYVLTISIRKLVEEHIRERDVVIAWLSADIDAACACRPLHEDDRDGAIDSIVLEYKHDREVLFERKRDGGAWSLQLAMG